MTFIDESDKYYAWLHINAEVYRYPRHSKTPGLFITVKENGWAHFRFNPPTPTPIPIEPAPYSYLPSEEIQVMVEYTLKEVYGFVEVDDFINHQITYALMRLKEHEAYKNFCCDKLREILRLCIYNRPNSTLNMLPEYLEKSITLHYNSFFDLYAPLSLSLLKSMADRAQVKALDPFYPTRVVMKPDGELPYADFSVSWTHPIAVKNPVFLPLDIKDT